MNCEEVQQWLMDGDEDAGDFVREAIAAHCRDCAVCAREREELEHLSAAMREMPEERPGEGLRENFMQMLTQETEKLAAAGQLKGDAPGGQRMGEMMPGRRVRMMRWIWQTAAACLILGLGIGIGVQLGGRKGKGTGALRNEKGMEDASATLGDLRKEVRDMKETLLFALLQEESASQRIKAVSYTEEMSDPDTTIIRALLRTLNQDRNTNVRLACLYSLAKFSNEGLVRDSLVASLPGQTEPLVQIVLINILAEMKEKRAIAPIRAIISDKHTLPDVKNIAEKSLRTI